MSTRLNNYTKGSTDLITQTLRLRSEGSTIREISKEVNMSIGWVFGVIQKGTKGTSTTPVTDTIQQRTNIRVPKPTTVSEELHQRTLVASKQTVSEVISHRKGFGSVHEEILRRTMR